MSVGKIYPRVGMLVRHQPSGLPARVEKVVTNNRLAVKILFANGMTIKVMAADIEQNVTEAEKSRFARDLVVVRPPQL